MMKQRTIVRVAQGIYGLPPSSDPVAPRLPADGYEMDPWVRELWSVVLMSGAGAVAWRASAARWWDLDGPWRRSIEVAVAPNGKRADPRVTRIKGLTPTDVTLERGLPVTTVARTLRDLASIGDVDAVERAIESGLRRRLVTIDDLEREVERSRLARRHSVLAAALRRRPPGAPPSESDAETLFLQVVRRAGLPDPVRQHPLLIQGRRVRLDAAWPERRLAVEIDGAATHASSEALGRDLRRQNALVVGGWTVLRFTWEDVARYPEEVIEVLLAWW